MATGIKLVDGQSVYSIGQEMELMLQVSASDVLVIGNSLPVAIFDIFDNKIVDLVAEKVGNDLYTVQWVIPMNLSSIYNASNTDESLCDGNLFYLKDVWTFPDLATLSFNFNVNRAGILPAVIDEAYYEVEINGVNNTGISETILFSSALPKYYVTVDMVRSLSNALGEVEAKYIVDAIIATSKEVDALMKPDVIVNQAAYDAAVRCYVSKKVAFDLLKDSIIGVVAESKSLDAFSVSRKYNAEERLKAYKDDFDTCALVIYAGGLDTPFIPARFTKGLYDPNRPNIARANLDTSDNLPWVNYTTARALISMDDGAVVELRGTRTIGTLIHTSAGMSYVY